MVGQTAARRATTRLFFIIIISADDYPADYELLLCPQIPTFAIARFLFSVKLLLIAAENKDAGDITKAFSTASHPKSESYHFKEMARLFCLKLYKNVVGNIFISVRKASSGGLFRTQNFVKNVLMGRFKFCFRHV